MDTRNRPVSFKRTFYTGTAVPGTASTSNFWSYQTWTFSQLPDSNSFAALFDQYRIKGIRVKYVPRYDSFAGNDTTDTTLPGITNQGGCMAHVIVDPYSNTAPSGTYGSTTFNSFCELGEPRTYTGLKPFSVYYKPTVAESLSSSVTKKTAPWIDIVNNSLVHNGHHIFFSDVNFTGNFSQAYDQFVTYYFECRGMR